MRSSLCNLCVLCVSVVNYSLVKTTTDTENAEVAQRRTWIPTFRAKPAAAQLANLKSPAVHGALAEAIRDFNSFEESALARLDWAQSIQIGPLNARFPLDVANVDFGFNEAFRVIAFADPEAAMAQADELRHENLRAQSLVEVGRAFLEKLPPKPQPKRRSDSRR